MAYVLHRPSVFATMSAGVARAYAALVQAPDLIVADRQRAAETLLEKSDDELAQLGLARARVAQDVHSHLYYS